MTDHPSYAESGDEDASVTPDDTSQEAVSEEAFRVTLTERPLVSNPRLDTWEDLRRVVLTDPKFAIHLAGRVLDGVTQKVAGRSHLFGSLSITKSMERDPRISTSLADGVVQLQRYRNLVAGNPETIVAPHDAYNFIDNVEKAIDLLESALNAP
jgi:hypothetical protein